MTGAGIVAGLVYWMIAGRNAGAWREPRRPCGRRRRCRRIRRTATPPMCRKQKCPRSLFIPIRLG